jgi:glycosyltransferase involved in cell wall biosynthesis
MVSLGQAGTYFCGKELPSSDRWFTGEFEQSVVMALESAVYDAAHFDMINMVRYADIVSTVPSVVSINDSLSRYFELSARFETDAAWQRLVFMALQRRAAAVEQRELARFAAVHVVSEQEKAYLQAHALLTNIRVIPIAVENRFLAVPGPQVRPESEISVLAGGNLSLRSIREPLLSFLEKAWPRARDISPALRLNVLGGGSAPVGMRRALARMAGVELVEWVDDYAKLCASSDIAMFLDARAGGMKNRVVQALASARPVVATEQALEGIDGVDGEHFIQVRDNEHAWAELLNLARDPLLRRRLGENARALVRLRYTQEVTGRAWEALYEEIAHSGRDRGPLRTSRAAARTWRPLRR